MRDPGRGGWRGIFARGEPCPHHAHHSFQAEFAGAPGIFSYVSFTRAGEDPLLDLAIPARALVGTLSEESVSERLAWAFQLRPGPGVLYPCARSQFAGRVLLTFRLVDGEGTWYASGAAARRGPFTLAQLLAAGIQLCRAGAEVRGQGIAVGSPGFWGLYVQPNRGAALVGGGLRWMFHGEMLAEPDDLRGVKEFLAGLCPTDADDAGSALVRAREMLGHDGPDTFARLADALDGLYRGRFGRSFGARAASEPETFEEAVDRAIGIANLNRVDEAVAVFESLVGRVHEVRDGTTLMRFWTNHAALLMRAGRAPEGLAMLEEHGVAEDAAAWRYRAWALDAIGRVSDADRAYRRATALAADDRDIMMDFAVFCFRREREESFRELYPRMVERFGDDDIDLWFLIGDYLAAVQPPGLEEERRHQRLADAGAAYDRAAALGADERAVALRKAALDHRRGEPGAAERVAGTQDLIERDGGGAFLWSLLGSVWGRLGESRRAEECLRRALAQDPHDAASASNLVDSLRIQRRFADLVAFAEQWIATTGHLPDAAMRNNLGVAYESLGDPGRAEDCYRRAAAADPSEVTIAANLMDSVRRRGADADAVLVGERFLAGEHPPLTAYFWNTLGLAYSALGRHARSADCHRLASELEPRSTAFVANAVMSLNAMNASEEAAALGEAWIADPANVPGAEVWNNLGVAHAALGAHDRAVACYRRALELHPRDVTSVGNLVASLRQTGALAEALRAFEEIAPLAEAASNAPVLNQGGLARMESGDPAGAERLYRMAMRIDHARPEYVVNLASVLRLQGRPAEAVAAAEEWLRGHGPDAVLLSTLGVAADAAGEPARAIARYREALGADPGRADVATLLLSCLHRQGDDPGACAFGDEWLARGTGKPGDAFWGLLGCARYALGDYARAEECFRTSFAMAPGNPNHACNLQLVLSAQGHGEELRRLGEEWLGRDDVHPPAETWSHLGVALFEAGRFEPALRCQQRGHALKPEDPVIAGNVVHCLCEAKRGDEAIAFGEAWLAVPGHDPNAGFLNTMGFAEFRARRPAAARGYFARAVQMEPSNTTFAENLTRAADLAAASAGASGGRSQ